MSGHPGLGQSSYGLVSGFGNQFVLHEIRSPSFPKVLDVGLRVRLLARSIVKKCLPSTVFLSPHMQSPRVSH